MKRLAFLGRAARRARSRRRRVGAPARQLHDQPLQPRRGSGDRALRPLRPRPGRDPDLPGAAGGSTRPPTAAHRTRRQPDRRRPARSLVSVAHAARHPQGAGGLRTTRLEVILRGPRLAARRRIAYRDTNYSGRIGWKEIVVGAATPQPRSRTSSRAYPKDLLASPLDVTPRHAPRSRPATAPTCRRRCRREPLAAPTASPTAASRGSIGEATLSWFVILALARARRSSGARRTPSRRGTGSRSSPAYLVGSRARRGMRRCSARWSPSRTRSASSRSGS